ncbi:uncharacterized membrane protein YgaE (UPF0421/DUF939 family) [Bacillus ectoiniformans]|uniref:aromatic acid exporter family protein n=1 Tax=Bacillus ectoiniformans TaxID=1494429 RepID=UPI003B82FEB9|nr:uncharacterized membrane protein YgaE (UPF0421/DUF939 family) [Bacillus ectoiniformans]
MKTGIAVFLTALICQLLGWPPMFAVITAIVTIEPTAADSIKKAYVRFPASAIGAAFSVIFNFAFGDSPLTYMLVAMATIIACYKLRLHEGTLVAVLTGVAMISTVHDHYVSSFFVRLATTGIGLSVSTLVNLLVIRPNYFDAIRTKTAQFILKTGDLIEKRGKEIIELQPLHQETKADFEKLLKDIESVETLCQYQKKEWKLHQFNREDIRTFRYEYKKLNLLRQINYHVGNLISVPTLELSLKKERIIANMVTALKTTLHHPHFEMDHQHVQVVEELLAHFKHTVGEQVPLGHSFSPGTIILYELLSIHDLLEELRHLHTLEMRHQELFE